MTSLTPRERQVAMAFFAFGYVVAAVVAGITAAVFA